MQMANQVGEIGGTNKNIFIIPIQAVAVGVGEGC